MKPWEEYKTSSEERGPWEEYRSGIQAIRKVSGYVPGGEAMLGPSLNLAELRLTPKDQWTAAQRVAQEDPVHTNILAGLGAGMYSPYLGAKQIIGQTDPGEVEEYRESVKGLRGTPGGSAGEFVGKTGTFLPASFLPGAQTLLGSALIGSMAGALEPTVEGESRVANTVLGGVTGAAGQQIAQRGGAFFRRQAEKKLSKIAQKKAQDALRDATQKEVQSAGYRLPPSYAKGGVGKRLLEGLSGKYKTEQAAVIKAQKVTNSLAKKSLDLPDDAPITLEALKTIRQEAFDSGYEPLRGLGRIRTDDTYKKQLYQIMSKYKGAQRSFPGIKTNEVVNDLMPLEVRAFDAADGIDTVKILREKASTAFRSGDNAVGKAHVEASRALEAQIERHLSKPKGPGPGTLRAFRLAREKIARSHTVEDALVEGTGDVDSIKIAKALAGKHYGGPLKTIAKFGDTYRKVARLPQSGDANPLTVLDYAAMTGLGAATLDPVTALAWPTARVLARQAILSKPLQSTPKYGTAPLLRAAADFFQKAPQATSIGLPVGVLSYD